MEVMAVTAALEVQQKVAMAVPVALEAMVV